jgi:hypothetical protein
MKPSAHVFLLIILSTSCLFAQDIKKCDIDVIGFTDRNLEKLTEKDIEAFLLTFDASCKNNVEYSEYSNEILFKIFDRYPKTLLYTLEKDEKKLSKDVILEQLGAPFTGDPDIRDLIAKTNKVKINQKLKHQIIEKLKQAETKK